MGDKFDTYEKQNMGQCAEKKYTKCTGTRHHGVLSVQLRRILSDSCAKKRAFPSARKNLAQDESSNTTEHQQKMCTLDNLEVIISVVVKRLFINQICQLSWCVAEICRFFKEAYMTFNFG